MGDSLEHHTQFLFWVPEFVSKCHLPTQDWARDRFRIQGNPKIRCNIYKSLGWIAPGFEIVQSHMPDWKFEATDTIADGGLHWRLIVGEKSSVSSISKSANELHELLAEATATLYCDKHQIEVGVGTNVLDSPLNALAHFLKELRSCPGSTDIKPGDVVTTGTWTDAYAVKSGETWSISFSLPQASLTVHFED